MGQNHELLRSSKGLIVLIFPPIPNYRGGKVSYCQCSKTLETILKKIAKTNHVFLTIC